MMDFRPCGGGGRRGRVPEASSKLEARSTRSAWSPAGEAVGQEGRALGGVLDPGAGERGQRGDRAEAVERSAARPAMSGRSAAAPER